MAIEFKHEYEMLELEAAADWNAANRSYRRLVHACHPDKFAQRPRERVHAQQQFIKLTKAFNNLRAFYRENSRLPFEPIKQAIADPPEPKAHQQIKPDDASISASSILNKRKPSVKTTGTNSNRRFFWAAPAALAIFAAIGVFYVIDRNAKLSSIEEAKRVLRTVQPSEYRADPEKISKANGRNNIVSKKTGNGIGDVLGKDLFK